MAFSFSKYFSLWILFLTLGNSIIFINTENLSKKNKTEETSLNMSQNKSLQKHISANSKVNNPLSKINGSNSTSNQRDLADDWPSRTEVDIVLDYTTPNENTLIWAGYSPIIFTCFNENNTQVFYKKYGEPDSSYEENICNTQYCKQRFNRPEAGKYVVKMISEADFNAEKMFGNLTDLVEVYFISAKKGSTSTMQMFYLDPKLESVNFGRYFDFSTVENIVSMFAQSPSLVSVNFGDHFTLGNSVSSYSPFIGCSSLFNVDLGSYFANPNGLTWPGAFFQDCTNLVYFTPTYLGETALTADNLINVNNLCLEGNTTGCIDTFDLFNIQIELAGSDSDKYIFNFGKLTGNKIVSAPFSFNITLYRPIQKEFQCSVDTLGNTKCFITKTEINEIFLQSYWIEIRPQNVTSNTTEKVRIGSKFYYFDLSCESSAYENISEDYCSKCPGSVICKKCSNDYFPIDIIFTNCWNEEVKKNNFYLKDGNTGHCEGTKFYSKCFDKCDKCLQGGDETNHNCIKCPSDLFLNYYDDTETEGQCENGCTSVDKIYKLTTEELGNVCVDDCPNKFIKDTSNKKCDECYSTCEKCSVKGSLSSATENNCITCKADYYQIEDNPINCVSPCPDGYLGVEESSIKKCKKCYESCKTCLRLGDETDHGCNQCKTNFIVLDDTKPNNCYSTSCAEGYFFDMQSKKCEKCFASCGHCNQKGNTTINYCTKCHSGDSNITYIKDEYFNKNKQIKDSNNEAVFNCYPSSKDPNKKQLVWYISENNSENYSISYTGCPSNKNYLNHDNRQCLTECNNSTECSACALGIKYLIYKKQCYEQCPLGTKENEDFPQCLDKIEWQKDEKENCYKTLVSSDYFIDNMDNAVSTGILYLEEGDEKVFLVKGYDFTYSLFDVNSLDSKDERIPNIEIDECRKKIIDFYHLDEAPKIYIGHFEKIVEGSTITLSKIRFYFKNGTEIDNVKTVCSGTKIIEEKKIRNDANKDLNLIKEFLDAGIDLTDPEDDFFNNFCKRVGVDIGYDMTLYMRREVLYQSNSFCEDSCEVLSIEINEDSGYSTAECECQIEPKFDFEFLSHSPLTEDLYDYLGMVNLHPFECMERFFDKEIFTKGILGNYTQFFSLLGQIGISIYIFYFLGREMEILQLDIRKNLFSAPPKKKRVVKKITRESSLNPTTDVHNKGRVIVKVIRKESNKAQLDQQLTLKIGGDKRKNFHHSTKIFSSYESEGNLMNYVDNKTKEEGKEKIAEEDLKEEGNNEELNIKKEITSSIASEEGAEGAVKLESENGEIQNQTEGVRVAETEEVVEVEEIEEEVEEAEEEPDCELNEMEFIDALKYDKRTFLEISKDNILDNQIFIATFRNDDKFVKMPIKISMLVFLISLYFLLNALFFTDNYIDDAYGKPFSFGDLFNNMIGNVFLIVILILIFTKLFNLVIDFEHLYKKIISRKNSPIEEKEKLIRFFISQYKVRIIVYFVIVILFTIIAWLYLAVFCVLYKHSQIALLVSTIVSIILHFIIVAVLSLIISLLRWLGLKYEIMLLYILSQTIQDLFEDKPIITNV
ncbi:MAG: hypothetical protein MJ252_00360 [archaeon]|nr:hypothetical protein [archaeon]